MTTGKIAAFTADAEPNDMFTSLREDGVVIIQDLLDGAACDVLQDQLAPHLSNAEAGGGTFYGNRAKRAYAVIAKAPAFAQVIEHSALLALADEMLLPNCDSYRVQLTTALETWPGGDLQHPCIGTRGCMRHTCRSDHK